MKILTELFSGFIRIGWAVLAFAALGAMVSYGLIIANAADVANATCEAGKHFADQTDECAAAQAVLAEFYDFAKRIMRMCIATFILAGLLAAFFPGLRRTLLEALAYAGSTNGIIVAAAAAVGYPIAFFALVVLWGNVG